MSALHKAKKIIILGEAKRERVLFSPYSGGGCLCGHVRYVRDPQAGDNLQVICGIAQF
jgi:hypothetical protein